MGGNRNEVASDVGAGTRAPASGYLCGVCDTPLLVGADTCIECGTPITGHEDRDGARPAPRPVGSGPTSPSAAPAATSGPKGRTPLIVGVIAAVVVIGALLAITRGGSDDERAAESVPAVDSDVTTATTAATTVTPAATTAELCDAVDVYSLTNMLSLGQHIVDDPAGTLAAYETILADAPAALQADVEAMGPLTETAVAAVESGEVTTTEAMQTWLANAPRQDLETWVAAQAEVAPVLAETCAAG